VRVLLSGVVGSTAYGLRHAGSDVDRLGVFAVPTEELHGLHRPTESQVTTEPDVTLHEAAKWCRLALTCNPTATELVWLPDDLYEVRTPLGDELIAIRASMLSAGRVRDAFLGYAGRQLRRLHDQADSPRWAANPGRAAKHARHLLRLLEQGQDLHRTGRLTVRLGDPEALREAGERVAERPELAEALITRAREVFEGPGVLPEAPDESAAQSWLLRVRAAHYLTR
jgi:uncharacterized protein